MGSKKGEGAGKGDADRVTNYKSYWNNFDKIQGFGAPKKDVKYIKSRFPDTPTGHPPFAFLKFPNEEKIKQKGT